MLKIKNLTVEIDGNKVLNDISMEINDGLYVILGKNGSGKTSLFMSLMGIGEYKIISGNIIMNGIDITHKSPYERSKLGLTMGFQKPPKIDGVKLIDILNEDYKKYMDLLNVDESFLKKEINKGLSGGEIKRTELLQVLTLKPKIALLDEPDSGVDIDSIKYIINGINELSKISTVVVVTHNISIIEKLNPKRIFVMKSGKIINSGGLEILKNINKNGLGELDV